MRLPKTPLVIPFLLTVNLLQFFASANEEFKAGFSLSGNFNTTINVVDTTPQPGPRTNKPLDANKAELSMLTSPHNFYFLEFPLHESKPVSDDSPVCGDGTPYSFVFRRGSDEHLSKLIVEFGGGPACIDGGCCEKGARQVPWYGLSENYGNEMKQTLPPLDSCPGIAPGFVRRTSFDWIGLGSVSDIPITLRERSTSIAQTWWEALGADDGSSDLRDWSYIYLPHCTMDWHLGYLSEPRKTLCGDGDEFIYQRGGTNMNAVVNWVANRFSTGLDALVTTSGGRIGGCDPQSPEDTSSIAPAHFASKVSKVLNSKQSSILVLTEGASLWNEDLPKHELWGAPRVGSSSELKETMKNTILTSSDALQFAWISSELGGSIGEREWLAELKQERPDNFHLFSPSPRNDERSCPNFTFPEDDVNNGELSVFISDVKRRMSWYQGATSNDNDSKIAGSLSFLSIFVMLAGLSGLAWMIYFIRRWQRSRKKLAPPMSPSEMWIQALTHYPLIFLMVAVTIPVTMSLVAFIRSGYKININLDFNSYLAIESDLDSVADNYGAARRYQAQAMLKEEENCQTLQEIDDENRLLLEDTDGLFSMDVKIENATDSSEYRHLQSAGEEFTYASGGQKLTIIYQNRNGGNVFTPEVLQSMYEFEQSILKFPGFTEYCYGFQPGSCLPFDSLVPYFFPGGNLVGDIDGILGSFLGTTEAIWKMDQYFGLGNLQSNITRTFIWMKKVEGDQNAINPFLEELFRGLFWERDQQRPPFYSDMVFTWENPHMLEVEANDALSHDAIWSVGSLCFIGLMIFLKVQDFFVFFFAMLGLILSFTSSYYWCLTHFDIQDISLLHISGLFVMLSIGADDCFLMIDSYEHSKIELSKSNENCRNNNSSSDSSTDGEKDNCNDLAKEIEMIRRRMRWAYSTAGSMMLVSSMTTAVCFFSNAFGVLLVIQEFGIYMGVVVLLNFLHVMTILPSAILVNEIHIKPVKQKIRSRFRAMKKNNESETTKAGADIEVSISNEPAIDVESDSENKKRASGTDDVSLDSSRISVYFESSAGASVQSQNETEQKRQQNCVEQAQDHQDLTKLKPMDRWLVGKYAPFITTRRLYVLGSLVAFAAIMAYFGATNFEASDGSIVLFSQDFNQGRLTLINDEYYNSYLSKTVEDGSSEGWSSEGGSTGTGTSDGGTLSGGGGSPGQGGGGTWSWTNPGYSQEEAPSSEDNGPSSPIGLRPSDQDNLQRKESIVVNLIWGIEPTKDSNLWLIEEKSEATKIALNGTGSAAAANLQGIDHSFNLVDPATQQWLFDVVQMARQRKDLNLQSNHTTWIEALHEFALENNIGFPIPSDMFVGYVDLLRRSSPKFETLVENEIGTVSPGLAGDILYASITLQADVVDTGGSLSLNAFKSWKSFTETVNELSPPKMAPVVAQSDLFWNGYRTEETVNSTVVTWMIANGLCFAIILLFTQNLLLCLMVMATIVLIFLCISGWLFAVFGLVFGPVQALGVSIFIGLSANYSLHIAHAYHHANSDSREEKARQAVFIAGSPICASALSTLGGSVFLFGCRTSALIELGMLICCITAMALLYSMGFLLAWLVMIGPLPYEDVVNGRGHRIHQWDLNALCYRLSSRKAASAAALDKPDNSADDLTRDECLERNIESGLAPMQLHMSQQQNQALVEEEDDRAILPTPDMSQSTLLSDNLSSFSNPTIIAIDNSSASITDSPEQVEEEQPNAELKMERLRRKKDVIELWHKEKKKGSDRSLMSYISEAELEV